ncbi:hypothetical protein Bca52824_011617 [Brassica carinata]|uniref:Uncharacterized protein n=1 Tax=Brassica carinata TaxID=52824 RepID=A0A8X7VUZ5_BRACI|nr:hypothetical protein Bca52824_011617 [Brassica carinata]
MKSFDDPVLAHDLLLYRGDKVAWHYLVDAYESEPSDTFWISAGTSDSGPEKTIQISQTVNKMLIHGPSAAAIRPKWLLFSRELKPVPNGVV